MVKIIPNKHFKHNLQMKTVRQRETDKIWHRPIEYENGFYGDRVAFVESNYISYILYTSLRSFTDGALYIATVGSLWKKKW